MYYIAIKYGEEWRIIKHVETKEQAVLQLMKTRQKKKNAAVFRNDNGKFKRLINL